MRKEQAKGVKEKRQQVETIKLEIDLFKGIKMKEISDRKKELVSSEKSVKVENKKLRESERSLELKKR
jgi:hypothetical protein